MAEYRAPPDGIAADASTPRRHRSSVLSLVVLGAIVGWGLSGRLGGGPNDVMRFANDSIELTLSVPKVIRDGEILEARLDLLAKERIDKLVIGIEPRLWHQLTTNAIEPAATSETYKDGFLRLTYDALEPGDRFDLQISQQVNPNLLDTNRGRLLILDGDRLLAERDVALKVLP